MAKITKETCPVCRGVSGLIQHCTICHGKGEVFFVPIDGLIEIHPILASGVMDLDHFHVVAPNRPIGSTDDPSTGTRTDLYLKGVAKNYITTFTGKRMMLVDPQPNMVCIEDIAHHLSLINHWVGASRVPFSVAQHSILLSYLVPPELRQWALIHDAAEAYLGDVSRPLKQLIPDYKRFEHRMMRCIVDVLKPDVLEEPAELKVWDTTVLQIEADALLVNAVLHDGWGNTLDASDFASSTVASTTRQRAMVEYWTKPQPWPNCELAFLARYRRLFLDDDGL